MRKLHFLLAILFILSTKGYSSHLCKMVPLSLSERVKEAEIIVEGEITHSQSYYNTQKNMIFTSYTLEVYKILKGVSVPQKLQIVIEGGMVGEDVLVVEPSPEVFAGDKGVFLLSKTNKYSPNTQLMRYSFPQSAQSVIKYDGGITMASSAFDSYNNIPELHKSITKLTAQNPTIITPITYNEATKPSYKAGPTFKSFSPDTITAGTGSTVTIKGSGFGNSYTGSAKLEMRNADDGGGTFLNISSIYITSWKDTQIVFKVPTRVGSGKIRVTDPSGNSATTTGNIIVSYNLLATVYQSNERNNHYMNNDNKGGYTWVYNTKFAANKNAVAGLERALQEWRCLTLANYNVDASSTVANDSLGIDGKNVVSFDSAGKLPTGVLGVTQSFYRICLAVTPVKVWVNEIDLQYNLKFNWNFTSAPASGGKMDFQSVVTHEIGHAHQLGHVIDTSLVMHYNIGPNKTKRAVDTKSSIPAVNKQFTFRMTNSCSIKDMTKLTTSTCKLLEPIALFSAQDTIVCLPQSVNFKDESLNAPASWEWDIDNDGTIDYTTQNPTHTYTKEGTYTVKLTVKSAKGNSSLTKVGFIKVGKVFYIALGNDTGVCRFTKIALGGLNVAKGGTKPIKYSWSPTQGVDSVNRPRMSVVVSGTADYVLTATDSFGCVRRDTVKITSYAIPFVQAGPDKQICQGTTTTIGNANIASGGKLPYKLKWTPNTDIDNDTISLPKVSPKVTTAYNVKVISAEGCEGNKDSVVVKVDSLTKSNFAYTRDKFKFNFTNLSRNATSLVWHFGDGDSSIQNNPEHTYASENKYMVKLVAKGKCNIDSFKQEVSANNLSIEEFGNISGLKVVYQSITQKLIISSKEQGKAILTIYNSLGKLILNQHINLLSDEVSIPNVTEGLYIMSIQQGTKTSQGRFIIKR